MSLFGVFFSVDSPIFCDAPLFGSVEVQSHRKISLNISQILQRNSTNKFKIWSDGMRSIGLTWRWQELILIMLLIGAVLLKLMHDIFRLFQERLISWSP